MQFLFSFVSVGVDPPELRRADGARARELQRPGAEHQGHQAVRLHADTGRQGTVLRAGRKVLKKRKNFMWLVLKTLILEKRIPI